MRQMMKAARVEARLSRKIAKDSQEMAEDMRRDSVSMKTVSFLPTAALQSLKG